MEITGPKTTQIIRPRLAMETNMTAAKTTLVTMTGATVEMEVVAAVVEAEAVVEAGPPPKVSTGPLI
jgi:hypothetical protein